MSDGQAGHHTVPGLPASHVGRTRWTTVKTVSPAPSRPEAHPGSTSPPGGKESGGRGGSDHSDRRPIFYAKPSHVFNIEQADGYERAESNADGEPIAPIAAADAFV